VTSSVQYDAIASMSLRTMAAFCSDRAASIAARAAALEDVDSPATADADNAAQTRNDATVFM
jgi:hypothetical protein